MLDFVLGLALAGLMVRGWMRGLVREALDLVGLVFGVWIALWLSRPLGEFLTERFGVSPELAGILAGVVLFVLFGVALAVAARYLTKVMTLPGLNTANRIGGSAVAVGWGVILILGHPQRRPGPASPRELGSGHPGLECCPGDRRSRSTAPGNVRGLCLR